MRLSLKLGALCAVAAFIPLVLVSLLILSQISAHSRRQALEQLRSDARVAASLCDKRLAELRAAAQELADEIANRAIVSSDNLDRDNPAAWARLQDLLPRAQNEASLDFVIVTDPLGRVIARHNDKPQPGETLLGAGEKNPIAEKVRGRERRTLCPIRVGSPCASATLRWFDNRFSADARSRRANL
jgi:sensor histidine kinase regulating citrate/malate metabolism